MYNSYVQNSLEILRAVGRSFGNALMEKKGYGALPGRYSSKPDVLGQFVFWNHTYAELTLGT